MNETERKGFSDAIARFPSVHFAPRRDKLPLCELYDLQIPGVKALIKAYINEFTALFQETSAYRIYASVPCPAVLAETFNKTGRVRIFTAELCALVVLRGILGLDVIGSLSEYSSGQNRCAMLEARAFYLLNGPLPMPDALWSFGLLCDECCKTDELITAEKSLNSWSTFCPKPGVEGSFALYENELREAIADVCKAARCTLPLCGQADTLSRKAAILILGISCLNSQKPVLKAGTLSLINTALLCVFWDMQGLCGALDSIRKSIRKMPTDYTFRKLYNYYIPPCMPELGYIFERTGIALVGDAAFLISPLKERFSTDLAGASAAAWQSSALSRDARTNAELTAGAVRKYDCDGYMTGMFFFDKWLGAGHEITNGTIEERSGKPVFRCDTDFWGRNFNWDKMQNLAETIGCILRRSGSPK